jgi:DNA helicase II / ATP-dependent DNA helicase PcrA
VTIFKPRASQAGILAYKGGKMGISAVPGAGKTHTLSALAAQLIRTRGLSVDQEVLIVTLVNSAVDNFSGRIKEFLSLPLPYGYRVRTLHGLANDIVSEKPTAVGLDERFIILDEHESELVRSDAVNTWLQIHPDDLDGYIKADIDGDYRERIKRKDLPDLVNTIALAFIRSAKDNRLTPEDLRLLLDQAPTPLPLTEMGLAIYSDYQRALAYRGAVDFDDLIRLAIELLERDSAYLERLRYRWPYILEDEAQDSSNLQEKILRLLAGEGGNWVRVGDPNQAIFETFTTASPQHLLDFIHNEADAYKTLPESGRCQPSVIALANRLIHWVNNEHPQLLVRNALTVPEIQPSPPGDPQPNPPDDPTGIKLIRKEFPPEKEIEAVADSIARWLPDHPEATLAVLVPRNARGYEVIDALKHRQLEPVELLGSTTSTRAAAGRLGDVVSALANPQSPAGLAKAYLAWRRTEEEESLEDFQKLVSQMLAKCTQVESFVSPRSDRDWLDCLPPLPVETEEAVRQELGLFRIVMKRWQGAASLPVDQMILSISQDLFTIPNDLAVAHKLALVLRKVSEDHADWRLPELNGQLDEIARNERRFLGFSEDDSGFDPSHHPGKVVVTTMHKSKGLEWDRVYLLSVNNYDFPSGQFGETYISEKWFIRDSLNLQAETLAQLDAAIARGEFDFYTEAEATQSARLDYVRERLRLLYVGITRAKKELIVTWNTGRKGNQTQSLPFEKIQEWWENQGRSLSSTASQT